MNNFQGNNPQKIRSKIIMIVALAMLPVIFIGCGQMTKARPIQETSVYQDSLESLFLDVPNWLASVYDVTSGGFYHNALMVKDSLYDPDMQSTAFALSILINGNMVDMDTIDQKFKNRIAEYVSSRYDSVTGYVLDTLYSDRVLQSDRALGRSQGMVMGILRKIGVESESNGVRPLRPDKAPEYLKSLAHFETWLHQQNWDRVWTAFDHIAMQGSLIERLPPERADSIVRYIENYVHSIQDEDGLWGKGQTQEVRFLGAAKYGTFCKNMNIPMPNPDKTYEAVMKWFRQNQELDFSEISGCPICVPRNALRLLYYLEPHLSLKISKSDREILFKRTFEMLQYYRNQDGGFMKNPHKTMIAPLDINYGAYDALISDSNGTHLAVTARKALYDILGLPVPELKSSPDLEAIINQ